ncbi:MAG: ribonuclease III family protein, partial [Lachnospiraceae bacterium]
MTTVELKELEKRLGYSFLAPEFLRHAVTHSSFANEHHLKREGNNERLEFLGDAVLEMISSEYLYRTNEQMPEGELTKLRASLVCEPTLAQGAREVGLGDFLLLGKGEEKT